MPQRILRKLEDVPEDIKSVFRAIQTAEEDRQFQHEEYVALYNSEENSSGNELRWIRMGRYDEVDETVRTDYFLCYETGRKELSARVNFSVRKPEDVQASAVKVSDNMYEQASESLDRVL